MGKLKGAGGLCTEVNLSFKRQAASHSVSKPNTKTRKTTTHCPSWPMAKMAQEEVLQAYRHLYRAVLRAVCYSQPASTVARDQLRRAFRDRTGTFDKRTVRRTVWFLNNAAREKGTEHKIVKSLLLTQLYRERANRHTWKYISDSNHTKKK